MAEGRRGLRPPVGDLSARASIVAYAAHNLREIVPSLQLEDGEVKRAADGDGHAVKMAA